MDHRRARMIFFGPGTSEIHEEESQAPHAKLHRKARVIGSGKAPDDHQFFDRIATRLRDANEVLVTGPSTAKNAFLTYVQERHPETFDRVVSVETLDHPTDGQLLAFAQHEMARVDMLRGNV